MRLPVHLAAALAAIAALAAPASGAGGYTTKALTFDVTVGPANDTKCTVTADLYTPDGASRTSPVPAILATNGFGGSKSDFAALAASYAKRGYAFLAYSGLGFGGSSCKITLDDPDWDGKAGSQLVSFLAGEKAANDGTRVDYIVKDAPGDPRVGMTGPSYGGGIQFSVASVDPRVDAINPQITWNNLEYSLAGNNTDLVSGVTSATPGVAKLDWPALLAADGAGSGVAPLFSGDASHLGSCPNFADWVCPGLVRSAELGYADQDTAARLLHASVTSYMSRIRIPVFLAQSENDALFNLREAVATYMALRRQHTPVKLLFRSQGHSGGDIGTAETDPANPEKAYESRMTLEWFDWYLRGIGDPPKLGFSFFRDWAKPVQGDAAAAVGTTPSYPAGTPTELTLPGTISLTAGLTGTEATGAAFGVAPAGPTVPGLAGALDSQPLGENLEIAGLPEVSFKVDAPQHVSSQSTTAGKLILFARLDDVSPTGTVTTPGQAFASARIGDVTKPATIALHGAVHRFPKGDRLRVVIGTGSPIRANNNTAGPVTISDVKLTIPKLGPIVGKPGAGPSGTTSYTPSPVALAVQPDGLGGPPRSTPAAARLPRARTCASRRRFVIHLRRPPQGDRIRSVQVLVNGKRARATRRRARIDLRGLPKGIVRVQITVRTVRGRTLRSARSYRTCALHGHAR